MEIQPRISEEASLRTAAEPAVPFSATPRKSTPLRRASHPALRLESAPIYVLVVRVAGLSAPCSPRSPSPNHNLLALLALVQSSCRENGIVHQEKLDENKFKVILAGRKDLEIIVERMNDSSKAMVSINGRESILEKIYIKSEEKRTGLPKILYIDLFGTTMGKVSQ